MLKNKTYLVTGANDGIGKETARYLAQNGGRLILLCRDEARGKAAQKELIESTANKNIFLYLADLASQKKVKEACTKILNDFSQLDVLINNAGFMGYPKRTLTEDGIESTFAVNHLGPFMITNLLMPLLKQSAEARVINVSSVVHKIGVFDASDLQLEKGYKPFQAYSNSKLMNVLFTRELAFRLQEKNITVNCLDPGKVYTGIGKTYSKLFQFSFLIAKPFLLTPKQGAETSIFLATSSDVSKITGEYFVKKKIAKTPEKAWNKEDMTRLWEISAKLTGIEGHTV